MEVFCSTVIASTVTVSVFCACCGREKLAEIKDGKVIIYDRRHGQNHYVIINMRQEK